jgi:biotin transporter BioY
MYIIVIAWLYVTVLMAATEKTITAGLLTFIFYGLLPCALLLWLLGVKHRRYKQTKLPENDMGQPDRTHTQSDQ